MSKPATTYSYDLETLSEMSCWPVNRIYQDIHRGDLDTSNIASVAVWLASNGNTVIRTAMASAILPAVLGTRGRARAANDQIKLMCQPELLRVIFEADNKERKKTAKRKSTGKLAK